MKISPPILFFIFADFFKVDVKVDKKKKEEDKPFIDQWSMDISVP